MDDRVGRLITSARKHFDYVVLDTPPVDPVVDGLYIAPYVDAIFFVIKWATTSQTVSKRSLVALKDNASPGTPIYATLNQQDQASLAKFYPYSEYYTS